MNILVLLSIVLWALCIGGVAWYTLSYATQITYVTLADGRQQARSLPLLFRLLLPFTHNLAPLLKHKVFQGSMRMVSWQLIAAGYEGLLSAREFLALRFLVPITVGLLLLLILIPLGAFFPMFTSDLFFPWLLGTMFAVVWPLRWLRQARKARATSILRALPFVLDLLTLSVEAGMDFMGAVRRNCESRVMDPLNEELLRLLREIQIGTTRKNALRNLSERLRIKQVRTICAALIQAEELGVGIGTILRVQSEQLRNDRFERAEKLANEAPTKILFPLLLFIFPATIIILVGPAVRAMIANFF